VEGADISHLNRLTADWLNNVQCNIVNMIVINAYFQTQSAPRLNARASNRNISNTLNNRIQ